MSIRLNFNIFATAQLFSPITGESKKVRERLQMLSLQLQSQLKRYTRIPSQKLPVHVHFKYFVNKSTYDPTSLLILSHEILNVLKLAYLIQDVNNKTVSAISVTVSSKYVDLFTKEGCEISFTRD